MVLSRREAMRRGFGGAAALLAATGGGHSRHARAQPPANRKAKAKSVIQIWMWGGPSHLDTFDPEAGGRLRLLRPAE